MDDIIYEYSNDQNVINKYEKIKLLGKGTFSEVYECRNLLNNKAVGVKIISKLFIRRNNLGAQLKREIDIHSQLNCNHILKLYSMFEDSYYVYLILELCEKNTLADVVISQKYLKEEKASVYFKKILKGIKYIHDKDIIHRDLKPSNILLNDNKIKIADFGLATKYQSGKNKTICGTPNFLAPEFIKRERFRYYDSKVDIWSLGVTLYCMLFGDVPFNGETLKENYLKICNIDFKYKDDIQISPDAKDIIEKCLTFDPEKRPSVEDLLSHPFILKYKKIKQLSAHKNISSGLSINKETVLNNNEKFVIYNRNLKSESFIDDSKPLQTYNYDFNKQEQEELNKKHIYVKKWANLGEKIGLGYYLNSKVIGVLFIDGSKINISSFGLTINYFHKNAVKTFNFLNIPEDLKKKCLVLEKFNNKIEENLNKTKEKEDPDDISNKKTKKESKMVNENIYVVKYKRVDNASIFYLNNDFLQIIFNDMSEIHINKTLNKLIYITRSRKKEYFNLSDNLWKNNIEIYNKLILTNSYIN